MSVWKKLGQIDPLGLLEARLELHWAALLPAMGIGRSLVNPRDDDSHTALAWRHDGWISEAVEGHGRLRVGLRPADLELTVHREGETPRVRSLFGVGLDQGLEWMRMEVKDLGLPAEEVRLESHFEMPSHPMSSGASFRGELRPGHAELSRYFGNTALLLRELAPATASIRTWPHHFDMAVLLSAGVSVDGQEQSVGVGLSPGDDSYGEPYLYVSPWPHPPEAELPKLPGGAWHTEGFTAAVLTASELVDQADQEGFARQFSRAAIEASRQLLGG